MSEFYERGRAVFADATSFVFFIIGFVAAGAFGWPALQLAFEIGAYDRGLAVSIGRILGGGLVAGVFGYGVGALAGRLWQAIHQLRRTRQRDAARIGRGAPDADVEGREPGSSATAGLPAEVPKRAPAPMTCRVGPLTPANYAAFSRRLGEHAIDRRYSEATTTEILTLVAWDGLEIAGVARLLSDGYGALFITDFAVDPYYVRDEVEQRLIAFALERVPSRGSLTRV
ncbi:MAG: hypothetical protein ACYC5V_12980 [Gemmatimonadaceae bacterium]